MEACWAATAPKDAGGGITLATPIFFITNDEEYFRKYQDCGLICVSKRKDVWNDLETSALTLHRKIKPMTLR